MDRHRERTAPRARLLALAAVLCGTGLSAGAADDAGPAAAARATSSVFVTAFDLAPASAPSAAAASAPSAASLAARASLERIKALRAQRPGDGLLACYQAVAHVALGEREAALAELRSLFGRRLGIVPAAGTGFDSLWADAEFQGVRERLASEEPRTADAPTSFRLTDPRLIPEGIAWDAARKRFLVGSIAQRKIVAIDRRGRTRDFSRPEDGLDAVLGLAVDARRRRVYAVSTNGFEDGARSARRNAVVVYDLGRGRKVARHDVAEALQLNDVAVAADGTLYVSDSEAGSLFRMRPGEHRFALFGAAGAARGANGVAVAPDGTVYVTLTTGIGRVEPRDGRLARLPQPDSVVSGGIDGLYWHEGDLIGVQNSTNPGRVIRLRLADGGKRIDGLVVLQSHHHPAFVEPTTGAIAGSAIHVLANTYVGRYQPDGSVKDAATLRPTTVLAVPLRR